MHLLDSSFVIDLADGDEGAVRKALAIKAAGERPGLAAVALGEVLIGANFLGGAYLRRTLELTAAMEVLDVTEIVAAEIGRMGAEQLKRGAAVPTIDLVIAATAKIHGRVLLTRDSVFSRIPGLAVEAY